MKQWSVCLSIWLLFVAACEQNKSGDSIESKNDAEAVDVAAKTEFIDPHRLGFATRLPKTAEFYIALHNPSEVFNALVSADVTELMFEQNSDDDSANADQEEMLQKLREVMIGDAFLCVDQGLAWQIDALGGFYQEMSATQIKLVAQIMLRVISDLGKGDISLDEGSYADLLGAYGDDAAKLLSVLIEQVDSNLDKLQVPSVYLGCSPPEGKAEEWLAVWSESIKTACEEEFIEPHGFEKYGVQFSGFRINLGGMMEEAQVDKDPDADPDEEVDLPDQVAGALERITAKLKTMTITVVCGQVDGYLLIYAGSDEDSLVLVEKADDSLVARPEFGRFGDMEDTRLLGVCYVSEAFLQSFQAWRGYEKSYRALAEAFGNEKLPESEKIVDKFGALAALENELVQCKIDPYLLVCALDDGLRIETVGGRHDQSLDYQTPLRLPVLTDAIGDDLFMRMHWMGDRARKEKQLDYAELLAGASGQILESCFLAFADENGDGVEWYEKSKQMYEDVLDPELSRLWTAYRDSFRSSLGSEVAVMIDTHGEMPRVPGLPSRYLKEGKIPRILYVRPVEDRVKLGEAYSALETTGKNLLDYASILTETELPMPDFLSAQKDDLTTWFYPFPTLTNDFVPGVSVSDTLFMVGSSKNFAERTYATWKDENVTQQEYTGMVMDIRFNPLWDMASHWIDLVEKEDAQTETAGDVEPSEVEEAEEATDYQSARKILDRMRSLESFHWHRRIENGTMRSTLRFHVSAE